MPQQRPGTCVKAENCAYPAAEAYLHFDVCYRWLVGIKVREVRDCVSSALLQISGPGSLLALYTPQPWGRVDDRSLAGREPPGNEQCGVGVCHTAGPRGEPIAGPAQDKRV